MIRRLGVAALVVSAFASSAFAERPRTGVIDVDPKLISKDGPLTPVGLVPYNTLFINRCASGCPVKVGQSNSLTDSWPINSNRTLTAFPYSDAVWQQVMSCVKDVFSPYQIVVTDVDPGTSANHFEIMIAGSPTDVGMSTSIGGVAPGGCTSSYKNNALVFDFAKVWAAPSAGMCDASCVEEICATAAQEIGHTWQSMDHVRNAKDPMTYFGYLGRKYFQNSADQCGSDCVNGVAPDGSTCNGTSSQSHDCICTGIATQNSHSIISSLFGLGPGTPPTVSITGPKFGASVDPGFSIYIDATDDSGTVDKVDLIIDGAMVASLAKGPYVFNAPTTLGNGTHHIEAIAYDPHQTPGSAKIDVVIGPPCQDASGCPTSTDACIGGRCVPGPGVTGGLGTTCATATDCVDSQCASDGTNMYCVEKCTTGQCPDGFGCLDDGTGAKTGVCWPGYDDGSGGCGCESNRPGGPLTLMLLSGVVVLTCRKRRR